MSHFAKAEFQVGEGKEGGGHPADNTEQCWRLQVGVLEGRGHSAVERGRSRPEAPQSAQTSPRSPASLRSNPDGDDGWGQGRNMELGTRSGGRQPCHHHSATHLRSRATQPRPVRSQPVGIGWGEGSAGGSGGAQAPPPPPRTRRLWSRQGGSPGSRLRSRAT